MKIIYIIFTTLILAGCSTSNIKPFAAGEQVQPLGDEKRLWHAAQRMEEQLSDGGQIQGDEALQDYLQAIMDRLYPEFHGTIRVHILKQPVLNAFALPNGGVYVNTGLIAAMENEAQLATVLAHEGIHFINKHSMKQRQVQRTSAAIATAVAFAGIPLLGNIGLASTVTGYSRDLEREADEEGFQRLVAAGYKPDQSHVAFEALAREAKASKSKAPLFFSTHPKLQERVVRSCPA